MKKSFKPPPPFLPSSSLQDFQFKKDCADYIASTKLPFDDFPDRFILREQITFTSTTHRSHPFHLNGNLSHVIHVYDTLFDYEFVVCVSPKVHWVKRIPGVLHKHLVPLGYRRTKLTKIPERWEFMRHTYIPPWLAGADSQETKNRMETFTSKLIIFEKKGLDIHFFSFLYRRDPIPKVCPFIGLCSNNSPPPPLPRAHRSSGPKYSLRRGAAGRSSGPKSSPRPRVRRSPAPSNTSSPTSSPTFSDTSSPAPSNTSSPAFSPAFSPASFPLYPPAPLFTSFLDITLGLEDHCHPDPWLFHATNLDNDL